MYARKSVMRLTCNFLHGLHSMPCVEPGRSVLRLNVCTPTPHIRPQPMSQQLAAAVTMRRRGQEGYTGLRARRRCARVYTIPG